MTIPPSPRQLQLLVLLLRPAVLYLLLLYAALGFESGGGATNLAMAECSAAVAGLLLFSVALNDIVDERIDRVNLAGDRRRPLVTGMAARADMTGVAVAGAVLAVVGSALLSLTALATTVAGLCVSAAYSVRPVRIAERGAVASLVLPACYVAVPYLDGLAAAGAQLTASRALLLAGLYLGFIGRILLKDFRDVRGDALFGKRTFLVRHGRRATCRLAAVAWTGGTVLIAWQGHSVVLDAIYAAGGLLAVALLAQLADDPHPRRDEVRICALAILGRGTMLVLLTNLYLIRTHVVLWDRLPVVVAVAAVNAYLTGRMLIDGPRARLTSAALGHIEANQADSADIVGR